MAPPRHRAVGPLCEGARLLRQSPRRLNRLIAALLLAVAALCAGNRGSAAETQTYKVDLGTTGDHALDATLKATSELISLRTSAPVGPFGLLARAQGDIDRFKTVLESFGYYQGSIGIMIDGLPIDDPSIGDELSARAAGSDAQLRVSFRLGPLFHLRRIEIEGTLPQAARDALKLAPGAPAVAADVLAAGERVLSALENQGYAFAKVDPPIAQEDPAAHVLDVSFHVTPGPHVRIGEIRVEGTERVHESLVRRRLLVHQGEPYDASRIEQARKDLLSIGVFASVSVRVERAGEHDGAVPIVFRIRERPRHAFGVTAAYSSDLGGSTGVTWSNRNVFGNAEQLTLAASAINLGGGTATTGIGYDTSAKYVVPDFLHRDQSLQLSVGAINQSLQAYQQVAATLGATLTRKFSEIWSASFGFTAEREHILQVGALCPPPGVSAANSPPCPTDTLCIVNVPHGEQAPACTALSLHYTLFAVPLTVLFNTTNLASPLDDPTHGWRASLSLAPTLSLGPPDAYFLVSQGSVATYLDLQRLGFNQDPGRSVVALRALAGLATGASQFSLPPDQRFYAGGSGTIRGYRYQAVGPEFADGNPIGGTAMDAASAEYRQRIGPSLGMAVFVDAGQVSANLRPLSGQVRFGTGAGVRYYTPIGPIRLDLAVPVQRHPGDDAFEIYIGLGQAF